MRAIGFVAAIISASLIAPTSAVADTYGSADRTRDHVVSSDVLGEERQIYVRTPPNYNPDHSYPVVYVLDGEWNFEFVASYLDYMFDNEVYPDLIVTGVKNVNRNRDYVPRSDAHFSDTGQADKFLAFVEQDWIRDVEKNYPTSGERILIGHSFGGVFTLHTLFQNPKLFDAYIALGASAWIGDRVLFEEASAFFERNTTDASFVYMAVGEGDGGPTVPSSQALAELFKTHAPTSLEWVFDVTPKADHFKNFATGMHDAFMALFPAWSFDAELMARGREQGAAGIDAWFLEKEAALGYRFKPSWFDLGVASLRLSGTGDGDAAMALMAHLKRHYPHNAHVASFAGSVFEKNARYGQAAAEYERAIAIARDNDLHPNVIHIDGLERGLKRNRDKAEAQ